MSITFINSQTNHESEIVIVNGLVLGFIHDCNGVWTLEIIEQIWEPDDKNSTTPECYEQTRQGIIAWINRRINFGMMTDARYRQDRLDDSPEVLCYNDEQETKRAAAEEASLRSAP